MPRADNSIGGSERKNFYSLRGTIKYGGRERERRRGDGGVGGDEGGD